MQKKDKEDDDEEEDEQEGEREREREREREEKTWCRSRAAADTPETNEGSGRMQNPGGMMDGWMTHEWMMMTSCSWTDL
jgi:hypothetical protein